MNELMWIELITVNTKIDRFVQLCMIMAHRDLDDLEKTEFKKLYLELKTLEGEN